ncbi:hypothetical protein D8674_037629 [Pyrus ussuriensis x Pyrus communis]|uniref:Uncharacterized protein n=1 Tax=Pyrus ussuriensis x Pyrus communis TaxID=2448454 RepID=A0A5N5HBN6_9ROSA|nr:hypothetical protein D8674_037629 [Pyrus ussuriensis x Pyrus communis]
MESHSLPCVQSGVKNTLFVEHFGHNWFALEFIDEDEMKYVLHGRGDDPNWLSDEGVKGLWLALPDTDDDIIFCFPHYEERWAR